jgi:hypothetical protein
MVAENIGHLDVTDAPDMPNPFFSISQNSGIILSILILESVV